MFMSAPAQTPALTTRPATASDLPRMAQIYNAGIASRQATFETDRRTAEDLAPWLDGVHPVVVVDSAAEPVIAFATTCAYSSRQCYAGIAEASVYVHPDHRRSGAATVALRALIEAARGAGFWKLIGRIFADNEASLNMVAKHGFRQVGVHVKHARLDGEWKNVVEVELLLLPEDPFEVTIVR
jgi:phosphinothricin acetyltransferase